MLSGQNIWAVSYLDTVWPLSLTLVWTPSSHLSQARSGHHLGTFRALRALMWELMWALVWALIWARLGHFPGHLRGRCL
jgi:hypothetical protein